MDQTRPRYHHGDLRAALLRAAEAELDETGVEGFSLRAVAKRAGVSHAAPAHHFGDVQGLLTALCVEGFQRFLACQYAREAQARPDPRSQLIAAGLGYVDFALANPALFRLMFLSNLPDHRRPDMQKGGEAAFLHLVTLVGAAGGHTVSPSDTDADGPKGVTRDVAAVWVAAHGMATLIEHPLYAPLRNLPPAERDAALADIIARSLPPR